MKNRQNMKYTIGSIYIHLLHYFWFIPNASFTSHLRRASFFEVDQDYLSPSKELRRGQNDTSDSNLDCSHDKSGALFLNTKKKKLWHHVWFYT